MQMEAGLDTGPVYVSVTTSIAADETAGELHDRLAWMGGELLCEYIDGIEQLKSMHLRSLLRKSKSRGVYLLATSHTGVAGLSVLYQTVVDVMLIKSLANRLLEDASPSVVELVSRELQGRDLDACTNVRDLWFELYDIVQDELLVDPMNLKESCDGGSIVCSDGSQRASDSHR